MTLNIFHHNRCNYVRQLLSEHVDERLNPREAALVEEHLTACSDCRKEYDSLRKTVGLLTQVKPMPVPHSFAITAVRPVPYPSFYRSFRIATVVIAVMLALVITGDVTNILPGLSPNGANSSPSSIVSATSSSVPQGGDVVTKVSDSTVNSTGIGEVAPPRKVGEEGPAPQGVQEDTKIPANSSDVISNTPSVASQTVPEGIGWLRSLELILIAIFTVAGTTTLFIWQRYKKIYN